MFSMSRAPLASLLRSSLAARVDVSSTPGSGPKTLPLGLRSSPSSSLGHLIDAALPEGGLPRGAVVELASPLGLSRATTLALAACASAQAEARLRGGERTAGAWCAWIEASPTLSAPAAARAGVDLERLLLVHPPVDVLARVAVRVAKSNVFSVIVIDAAGVPGRRSRERLDRWITVVRRLSLAVEGSDTSIVLLTDLFARRSTPLPVAMRIEIERPALDRVSLHLAKDRRGRVAPPKTVPLLAAR
jgi:recombination protein RecA